MLLSNNGTPFAPCLRKFSVIITKSMFIHNGPMMFMTFYCCSVYFHLKTLAETWERLSLSIELQRNCFCSEKCVFVNIFCVLPELTKSVHFIIQNDVAINALAQKDNKYPHIIAVGENEKDISRYFISVDNQIIDVCSK